MKKLNGLAVAEEWNEYGVEVVPGSVLECVDEREALDYGGTVVRRTVYITEWTQDDEVQDQDQPTVAG